MRLVLITLLLGGCASQLDIREGDCSITMVEVDAKASSVGFGGVEADGWVMVQRGTCPETLIEMYKQTVREAL
jgi:hypothetical protein